MSSVKSKSAGDNKPDSPVATATSKSKPTRYYASIYPGEKQQLPSGFADAVRDLESLRDMPVFLLVHGTTGDYASLDQPLFDALMASRDDVPSNSSIALLVDSPGGQANAAYQIATFFRRQCGSFDAVIPRYAKSAATLLVLGARKITLGRFAELGPLDMQVYDPDRESHMSALDEVQALDRLHAFSLDALDRSMFVMVGRTGKKVEALLPTVCDFMAKFMEPLLKNIDTVHYSQMARALKIAEEYAIRLLQPRYQRAKAEELARQLVEDYPDHGFVIDYAEAKRIALAVEEAPDDQADAIDRIAPYLKGLTAIGLLREAGVTMGGTHEP